MLLFVLQLFFAQAMQVEVKPLSYVESSQITLLDIVEQKKLSRQDKDFLRKIELANKLESNSYRVFNRSFLVELMRTEDVLKKAKIQIPEKAYVASKKSLWTKKNIEQSLRTKLAKDCMECEVETNIVQYNKLNSVIGWQFEINKDIRNQRIYVPVSISYIQNGELKHHQSQIVADVFFRKNVPVLVKNLNRGEVISEDDIVMKKILLPSHGRFYTAKEDVLGMKTRKVLKQGQLLLFNDLNKALAIRRGESVQVKMKNNNIEISLSAIAKENGSEGETIRIKIPETDKVMHAKILSSSEVELQ